MKPTPEQIVKLADAHVAWFTSLLEGRTGLSINTTECRHYLNLWEGIRDKDGKNLVQSEQNEVMEAVWSGDYDELLGITKTDER